jgi:hypothetical protein
MSLALKSRTCSSYSAMSVGLSRRGMRWWSQPPGLSAGLSRLATKLRWPLAFRLSEQGAVTTLLTTRLPAQRDSTSTV